MTISPTYGDAARALPGAAAGNDSTLVGAFLPRQLRLSARIAESSLSTIASSIGRVETASAAAKTAFLTMVLAVGRLRHRAERTMTSICTSVGACFPALRLLTCFSLPRLRGRVGEGALFKVRSQRSGPPPPPSPPRPPPPPGRRG